MTALYILCQCTWGAVQSLAGAVLLLFVHGERRLFRGAVVTKWRYRGSVSLGMFIFLSDRHPSRYGRMILTHEYGHTVQSLILGPLYLIVIGLPSLLWAGIPLFSRLRQRKHISYYRLYTERWANFLGKRLTGGEVPE